MRILLVTHAPLLPELGAAQMALNLAAALRARGHDAVAWSTEPLPAATRAWNTWLWQRRRLEDYLAASPRFDVVDVPAISISRAVYARGPVVARSIQPDLRYLGTALAAELRVLPRSLPRLALHSPLMGVVSGAIVAGWRRASVILCLGTHERDWMARRFPWTCDKLEIYMDAPSAQDQAVFAGLRAQRAAEGLGWAPRDSSFGRSARPVAVPRGPTELRPPDRGLRFLWMGRWVPHKGTRLLLRFLTERARSHPEDRFTFAGCGDQAARDFPPELQAAVAAGRLRLLPSFDRAELPGLLAEHDAGLFTSSVEGWGLSLNEMLEAGLPVFATRAGGVSDLLPYFPHSLRPFPPPESFAPPRRLEDLAANGYSQRFSWESIARSYEEDVLGRLP